jgi:hypothetical protein
MAVGRRIFHQILSPRKLDKTLVKRSDLEGFLKSFPEIRNPQGLEKIVRSSKSYGQGIYFAKLLLNEKKAELKTELIARLLVQAHEAISYYPQLEELKTFSAETAFFTYAINTLDLDLETTGNLISHISFLKNYDDEEKSGLIDEIAEIKKYDRREISFLVNKVTADLISLKIKEEIKKIDPGQKTTKEIMCEIRDKEKEGYLNSVLEEIIKEISEEDL